MWKSQLNRAIREVRFVLKQSPDHHGVWRFAETKLPELKLLNQNTFFTISEISDDFKTPSACHFVYGDVANTEDAVESAGLSPEEFEKIFKSKVAYGLTLGRHPIESNDDRELPVDIVESHKYVQHADDSF
mmetsp:Transcript_10084/g.16570  ORF Transcript_10084/g.16570 Transcript_10084/m.16570 type:complete len:131 (-) Transcript_10084:119-511(-)